VDGLLRAYFRAQVPVPWPVPATPAPDQHPTGAPVRRWGVVVSSRFALAAAVAFFVLSFWELSSRFPVPPLDSGPAANPGQTLGARGLNHLRPGVPARTGKAVEPTRNGGEALLQWERLPDGLFMRIEEKRPPRP